MAAYHSRISFPVGESHERAICTIAVPQSLGVERGVLLSERLQEAIMKVAREVVDETSQAQTRVKPEPKIKSEPMASPTPSPDRQNLLLIAPALPPQQLSLWLVNEVAVRLQVHVYASATVNELRWAWARHQGQHGDLFGIEYQGNDLDLAVTVEQVLTEIVLGHENCANRSAAGSEG